VPQNDQPSATLIAIEIDKVDPMSRNAGCDPGHLEAAHRPRDERVEAWTEAVTGPQKAVNRAQPAMEVHRGPEAEAASTAVVDADAWRVKAEQAVAMALKEAMRQARFAAETEAAAAYDLLTEHWRAKAARERDAALKAARADAQREAAATLGAEKARWKEETRQAVTGAVNRARAEADEEQANRERHWRAEGALAREAAAQAARVAAETEAAAAYDLLTEHWRAEAARERDAALKAARAAAQREAAATLGAEKARFAAETAAAVAGAVKQTRADEELVNREWRWHADAARTTETAPQSVRSAAELTPEQAHRELRDVSQTPEMTNGHDAPAALSDRRAALDVARSDAGVEAETVAPDSPVFFRQLVSEVQSPATGWRRLLVR